jgi:hypothetical protein
MRGPPNSLPRCFLICKGRMGLARGKGSLIRAGPSYPQRPEVPWLLTCATQPRTVSGFVDHHYLFVFSLFLERLRSHGHEENLSTEQTAPQAQPWVPSPHGYSRGTGRAEASPGEGPRALDALVFFQPQRIGSGLGRISAAKTPARLARLQPRVRRSRPVHRSVLHCARAPQRAGHASVRISDIAQSGQACSGQKQAQANRP